MVPTPEELGEWHDEASQLYSEGDFAAAEAKLKALMPQAEALGKQGERVLGLSLNTLAGIYRATDREELALETNLRALELLERHLPEDDYDLGGVVQNCADLAASQGRLDDAMRLAIRAIDLKTKSLGAEHPELARAYSALGDLYFQEGHAGKARETYEKALKLAALDKTGDMTEGLAAYYSSQLMEHGQAREAKEMLERSLATLADLYSEPVDEELNDPSPTWVLNFWAARNIIRRKEFQKDGIEPETMRTLREAMAAVLIDLEDFEGAVAQFEHIFSAIEKEECRLVEMEAGADEDAEDEDAEVPSDPFLLLGDDEEDEPDEDELNEMARRLGLPVLDEDDEEALALEDDDDLEGMFEESEEDLQEEARQLALQRGVLHMRYGMALHFLGQKATDGARLRDAHEQYLRAQAILREVLPADHEALQDLQENLEELEEDMGE